MAVLPRIEHYFWDTQPFGFVNGANYRPIITSVSIVPVLPTNYERRYVSIFNNSGVQMFIKYGEPAVVNQGIRLSPNQLFEVMYGRMWVGAIFMVAASGTQVVDIFEGTS